MRLTQRLIGHILSILKFYNILLIKNKQEVDWLNIQWEYASIYVQKNIVNIFRSISLLNHSISLTILYNPFFSHTQFQFYAQTFVLTSDIETINLGENITTVYAAYFPG